jgi:hypothetical protein
MNSNPITGRAVGFDERLIGFLARLPAGKVPDAETAALIGDFGASIGWQEVEDPVKAADPEPQRFDNPAHKAQALLAAKTEASQGYSCRDKGNLKAMARHRSGSTLAGSSTTGPKFSFCAYAFLCSSQICP